MRKVVYGLGISPDGYITRPDGSVDFLFMPKDYSMAPFFKRCDTAVLGWKTYEAGLKMSGGKVSGYGMKCYIFSKTLGEVGHKDFVVVKEAPKPFIEAPGFPGRFAEREFQLAEDKTYSQGMIALRFERTRRKRGARG